MLTPPPVARNFLRFAIILIQGIFLLAFITTSAWGAIATDVTVSSNRSTSASNITTSSFSTTSTNELLLAFVATDAKTQGIRVTSVTGASLTWVLVRRTNTQLGTAEIWRAFAANKLSSVTVRANLSQSVAASITVVSFTGTDTSGTNGSGAIGATGSGNANPGAPAATLVTTRSNSFVFGVGNDWDNAISRTVPSNQTMVNQYLASLGDTFWVQRQNVPTSVSGTTVTINDTAPATDRYNLTIVEVLAAPSTGLFNIVGSVTPVASGTGATVQLSGIATARASVDTNGNYSFTGLGNGTYTVTPSKSGYSFSPTSQQVTISGANITVPVFSVTTTPDTDPPSAPSNLIATASGPSQVNLIWAVSTDNVSVKGYQILRNGNQIATSSIPSYSDTTVAAGTSYDYSVRAYDTAGNVSADSTTASVTTPMFLSSPVLDVAVTTKQSAGGITISSPSFSTAKPNELLLAFIASDGPDSASAQRFTAVTGGGLTWTLRSRANAQAGTAEIWQANATNVLSNVVVTATRMTGSYQGMITIAAFQGASLVTNGTAINASAASGAPSVTLTTTQANSLVWSVGDDWDRAVARTVSANQTIQSEYLAPAGDTFWVQYLTAPVAMVGDTATISCSAPTNDRWNFAVIEIVPITANPTVVNSLEDIESPPYGVVTLRSAINQVPSGGVITFDSALNGKTILLSLVGSNHTALKGEVYSGMTFQGYADRDYGKSALYARKDLTIDASALPDGVTIAWNGGDANRARVLAVYGNLSMKNVTITSGYSFAEAIDDLNQPFTLARGGGLAVWGTLMLEKCTVSGNRAIGDDNSSRDRGTYGGGIYANGLDLTECIISGNSATGYGAAGGGIYSVGGADNSSGVGNDAVLNGCTVSGNRVTAHHAYGGGIFTLAGGPNNLASLNLSNCTIARNLVEDNMALPAATQFYFRGGGIYMGGGSLSLVNCTVAENEVNGTSAIFSGKPNIGGGGIAATIGNAHVVENVHVQHSIIAGNKMNGAAADWFTGSLYKFFSNGYNRIGVIDFSQILVPVPDWMDLSRKHYPKVGDQNGVTVDQVLTLSDTRVHNSVLSVGTDYGQHAVLWYPPAAGAVDQVPAAEYSVTSISAGYQGFGVSTDDFLNQVLTKLRTDYSGTLGWDFGTSFGDIMGVTWYGPGLTWPSNPQNTPWINFWRNLDIAIDGRLGTVTLGDDFWGTFHNGSLGNVTMTVTSQSETVGLIGNDQLGTSRPFGSSGDIGAIETVH